MAKVVLSSVGQILAQEQITAQLAVVASLAPTSAEHRAATNLLLLLQDALALLTQLEAALSSF